MLNRLTARTASTGISKDSGPAGTSSANAATQDVKLWHIAKSQRAWIFLTAIGAWGLVELVTLSGRFHVADPSRLALYLVLVAVSSYFRLTQQGSAIAFALNLPFLLVSILDLSIPEATLVAGLGALIHAARTPELRKGQTRGKGILFTGLAVGMQTMAVATAGFALDSLLPHSLQSTAVRLVFASLLLFAANTLPVAIALRLSENSAPEGDGSPARIGALWKASYFWAIPYYLVGAALAQAIRLGPAMIASDQSMLLMVALYLAYRQYRVQRQDWASREKHAADMAALHLRAIEGLALAVEAKDVMNTRGHLRRVQVYALGVGRAMGLTSTELEALHAGSLLHDIGKLAVPEHILTKPGKLTPEEFAKMKVHPLVGAEIVDQMQFPYAVAPIVRAHHEKWDGSGYPYGLKGEQIPIGARILTAVDFLDAMTSDREYRRGVPMAEAMAMLRAQSGTAFDPAVVAALDTQAAELEAAARAQAVAGPVLSTGVKVERGSAPDAGLDLVGLAAATGVMSAENTQAASQSTVFRQLLADLGGEVELNRIFAISRQTLSGHLPFDAIAVFLPRGNALAAEFALGTNAAVLEQLEVPVGQGVTGWVAQNVQPMVNGNPSVDPGYTSTADAELHAVLAVPLMSGERLEGVLSLYRGARDSFSRVETRLLTAVAPALAGAIQNARAHRRLQANINTDQATGVPNGAYFRQMLADELKRAERRGRGMTLVLIDLAHAPDGMHDVNPAVVDDLVASVGLELQRVSREYDSLGRLGAHRFGLLLPGLGPANAAAVVSRLRSVVEQVLVQEAKGSIDFGLAGAFYPNDGEGARHILDVAENRLKQGVGRWETSLEALRAANVPQDSQTEPSEHDLLN